MNNGYALCFNKWALDENIKNEIRLLLIISSLTAKDGYCFASNKYLAELFNETEQTISKKIKTLEENEYIEIDYEKRGWEIINRKIRLRKIVMDDYEKSQQTINQNVKDNNINNNNTSNNNIYNKAFEEIETIYGRTLNSMEYEKLINLFEKYNEKQVIHIYKKYGNKPVEYISKVLATTKPKVIPEWTDKEITNESMDNVAVNDFNNFKNFLEGFRDGNI